MIQLLTNPPVQFFAGVLVGLLIAWAASILSDCPEPETPLIKQGQGRE